VTDPLAGPRRSAWPLHEVTDHWRRGVRPPILLPCVCDGPEIRAMSSSQADIAEAVQRHQIEPVHIAWDEAHGTPLAVWQLQAKAVDAAGEGA
jgi:hypothetical protein